MDSTADLQQLADWLEPLIHRLEPRERAKLARSMATELRKRQAARIAAQQNPDGTPYAHRKPQRGPKATPAGLVAQAQAAKGPAAQHRQRLGAMFQQLRTAKWLKAQGDKDQASVAFLNRVQRIAQVHQWGLQDRPEPGGPLITYPARGLLGINRQDTEALQAMVLQHLANTSR